MSKPSPSNASVIEGAPTNKRILLCEGYAEEFTIEAAHVRQGDKIFVARGNTPDYIKSITESVGSSYTLVESLDALDLHEDANGSKYVKNGVWIVEGPAQRSDTLNRNKRKYSRKLWERIIGDPNSPQQKLIKARGMLGHLEHPADGRMDGREGALVVVESKLRSDGVVWNKFELLDTPHGKILQEYTRKNVPYGVSTRGNGSVASDGTVSESDFQLDTWDAVMRPSTYGAYPTLASGPERLEAKTKVLESASNAGTESVTEAEKALTCASALVEADYSDMGVAARCAFFAKASSALSTLTAVPEGEAKTRVDAQPMVQRLLSIMASVAKQPVVESVSAPSKSERADGFGQVITLLQQKAKDALSDVALVQHENAQLNETVSGLTSTCDRLRVALYKAETERELVESKLRVTTQALTAPVVDVAETAISVLDDRDVLLAELVESFPALTAHRQYLSESESPASMVTRAIGVLAAVRALTPVAAPVSRFPSLNRTASLPPAAALVESSAIALVSESTSTEAPDKAVSVVRAMFRTPSQRATHAR